jgi:hypothetical protein
MSLFSMLCENLQLRCTTLQKHSVATELHIAFAVLDLHIVCAACHAVHEAAPAPHLNALFMFGYWELDGPNWAAAEQQEQ